MAAKTPPAEQPRWIEYVDIDKIQPYEGNPKNHDSGIGTSIDRHGYVDAMIIDERTGRLVSGHGRLDELKGKRAAGESPPEGISVVDGIWMAPTQRGWASKSDADAEAYLLGANQLPPLGGWDDALLAEMMQRVAESPEGLDGSGFDDGDLMDLLDKLNDNEEEDVLGKARGDATTPTGPKLTFGSVTVLITDDELAALNVRHTEYSVGNGNDLGFVRHILGL